MTQIALPRRTLSKWRKPPLPNGEWLQGSYNGASWITDGYFCVEAPPPTKHKVKEGVIYDMNLYIPRERQQIVPKLIKQLESGQEVIEFDNGTYLSPYYVSLVLGVHPTATWEQKPDGGRWQRIQIVVAVVDGRPVGVIMPIRP